MDDASWFFTVLIAGVITGFIGLWIAKQKGRSEGEGFLLGFLLSVIGLIIEGLLPETAKPNPVKRTAKADSRVLAVGNPVTPNEPPHLSADGRPLKKCPFCAEMILAEAIVCRYCQRDLPEEALSEPERVDQTPQSGVYYAHPDGSLYHRDGCPCIPEKARAYSDRRELTDRYQPCCFCNPHKDVPV